jgi:hypothetical protein
MTKNYTHLSLGERYQIEVLQNTGMSQKSIAQAIGVHPSTVCPELRRNLPSRGRNAVKCTPLLGQKFFEIRFLVIMRTSVRSRVQRIGKFMDVITKPTLPCLRAEGSGIPENGV